jgi:LppP/LprE lipoprotein
MRAFCGLVLLMLLSVLSASCDGGNTGSESTATSTAPGGTPMTIQPGTIAESGTPISPSVQEIGLEMSRTVEGSGADGPPSTHFTAFGEPLTVSDGEGGWLTAIIGVRFPTADAYGQLVFFWHNADFLGWDSKYESNVIRRTTPAGPGEIRVTYDQYSPDDALCCPSLPPLDITFRWDGTALQPDTSLPTPIAPFPVRLLP